MLVNEIVHDLWGKFNMNNLHLNANIGYYLWLFSVLQRI